jgi:hypothetical protein
MASKKAREEKELFSQYQVLMKSAGLEPAVEFEVWRRNYRQVQARLRSKGKGASEVAQPAAS